MRSGKLKNPDSWIPMLRPYFRYLRSLYALRLAPDPSWLKRAMPSLAHLPALMGKDAYRHILAAARLRPDPRKGMREIANFLCHSGLQDEGIRFYEALLNIYGPGETVPEAVFLPYLQMMQFGSPDIQTNRRIYDAHTKWGHRFESGPAYTHYDNPLTLNRRVKIGYTCHFMTNSTSTTLLQPLLAAHHRDRVEIYMYSDEPGRAPDRVRGICEHWRDTYGINTQAFCELVRADGIDILLELNGLIPGHRYHAIARHPAPVQASWYNYTCTTGVPGMDYTITSADIPVGHLQPYYSEKILPLKGTSLATPVGDHFPPVSPTPFLKNGYVTFASFGQAHKVTRAQILLWCEIVKRVPGSKFFMKAEMLGRPQRSAFVKHFSDGGVDASRLILEGNSDYAALLHCYGRVDIALDTYPYNAGTTSAEAVMMGVPIVSLVGDRYCSQVACAIVGTGGHPELQCRTPESFVETAVSLANDPARLERYRDTLREDYKKSPRNDLERFVTEFEDAFEEMWRDYVKARKGKAA